MMDTSQSNRCTRERHIRLRLFCMPNIRRTDDYAMDQYWWEGESVNESRRPIQKKSDSSGEKSSSTPDSTNSRLWVIMGPMALLSGILGGLFVTSIYAPVVYNDSTNWPDEGGFIAMLFATVALSLFGYLWRVIQR